MWSDAHWQLLALFIGPTVFVLGGRVQIPSSTNELSGSNHLFTTNLRLHLSVNIPVAETSSILCVPPTPWPVGVEVTCILAEFEVDSREVVVYKLVACCVGGLDRLRVAGSSDGACVCFFFWWEEMYVWNFTKLSMWQSDKKLWSIKPTCMLQFNMCFVMSHSPYACSTTGKKQ